MSHLDNKLDAFSLKTPAIFDASVFKDSRGRVEHFGYLTLEQTKRMYFIENSDTGHLRGWHGHKLEHKAFLCISGEVKIRSIQVEDWDQPEPTSPVQCWTLASESKQLLVIPGGYANAIESVRPGSIVLVQSNRSFEESLADDFRWPSDHFVLDEKTQ